MSDDGTRPVPDPHQLLCPVCVGVGLHALAAAGVALGGPLPAGSVVDNVFGTLLTFGSSALPEHSEYRTYALQAMCLVFYR